MTPEHSNPPVVITPMPTATPVIATITGKDLLDRLDGVTNSVTKLEATLHDVPKRLGSLEQWRWKAVGAATLVSSLISGGIVGVLFTATHH